jgi:predicted transcriptional regulator
LNDILPSDDLLSLTAEIVSAHVGNNRVSVDELPTLIASVHQALAGASATAEPAAPAQEPAVPIRSSIKPDHLVSLESGKKMKMLKRYLMTNYGMTPADYRAKWGLPRDYPMVAPDYSRQRKELAVKSGLGRGREKAPSTKVTPAPADVAAPPPAAAPAPEAAASRAKPKSSGRSTLKIKVPKSEPRPVAPVEVA